MGELILFFGIMYFFLFSFCLGGQYVDQNKFYLPLDTDFFLDTFKTNTDFLCSNWTMLGRPTMIFPAISSMLGWPSVLLTHRSAIYLSMCTCMPVITHPIVPVHINIAWTACFMFRYIERGFNMILSL